MNVILSMTDELVLINHPQNIHSLSKITSLILLQTCHYNFAKMTHKQWLTFAITKSGQNISRGADTFRSFMEHSYTYIYDFMHKTQPIWVVSKMKKTFDHGSQN